MSKRIVTVKELAAVVYDYGQYLKRAFTPDDLRGTDDDTDSPGYGDFRLQIHEGTWETYTGDAQYDQDHRGTWGSASVPRGCTRKEAHQIAVSLIDEAMDLS